ncbi:MAG: hypothetical protein ABS900_00820, partial [Candidatus Limivicinus sp.]
MKQIKSILAAVMMLAVLLSLFLPGMAFAEEKEEGTKASEVSEGVTVPEEKSDEIIAPEIPENMTALEMAAQTRSSETLSNRFNVMMVLDASASMDYTDRAGYRYEAMKLFTNLMADEGNVLGGEVFSTAIDREVEMRSVSGQLA